MATAVCRNLHHRLGAFRLSLTLLRHRCVHQSAWRPSGSNGWTVRPASTSASGAPQLKPSGLQLLQTSNPLVKATAEAMVDVGDGRTVHVEPDLVSADEEKCLVTEVDRRVRSFSYERGHFDDVIHHYRELLGFKHISPENASVLARIQARTLELCGNDPSLIFLPVHILDLHPDGYILPHIDNYCGRVVAGVSLLSDSVMRMTRPDRPKAVVDLYLPRRSFYCLQGLFRYTYRHEIRKRPAQYEGRQLDGGRRVSLIFREQDPHTPASP